MVDLLIREADVLQLRDESAEILAGHDIAVSGSRIENTVKNCGRDDLRGNCTQEAELELDVECTRRQGEQAVAVVECMRRSG